jgi:predicted glycosyltransferase
MSKGHDVCFVIKKKDILQELLDRVGYTYTTIREGRSNSRIGLMKSVLEMELNMCRFLKNNKIDILLGTTLSFASSKIMRVQTIAMGEDDASIVPRYAEMVYPWANAILSPFVCDNGTWNNKSIKYPGYQKLAYLHPNYFTPSRQIVEGYGIDLSKPYFILRFASLNAHHDDGVQGINTTVAQRLVDMLKPYGQIFISSERELEPQFEPYRLRINPLDIHHLLAFASLYIGDSQSMAVEACMLGTPCLRFNDFVGQKKISVLEELEHVYQLTNGIHSSDADTLYQRIDEILALPEARAVYQARRQRMLNDKIDVTKFWTWFLENYPASAVQYSEDDEFWKQFK